MNSNILESHRNYCVIYQVVSSTMEPFAYREPIDYLYDVCRDQKAISCHVPAVKNTFSKSLGHHLVLEINNQCADNELSHVRNGPQSLDCIRLVPSNIFFDELIS